ncbi:hypothetical protein HanIR_Chr12g0570911 [Helianthus annuus]|nr:hypothetical protein HanIR_Chr12g0570911 [Helianthus annuus]
MRIIIIPNRLHDRPNTLIRINRIKHLRSNKHTITPQLHHKCRIRRRHNPTRSEMHNRKPPHLFRLRQNIIRRA